MNETTLTAPNLYMPKGAITLDQSPPAQIRLGLQGYPKTGKTWAALTFPNPVVLNLNRGLGAHQGRKDVVEIPIYKEPSIKNAVIEFLRSDARRLTRDQTLVIDALTDIDSAYHTDWEKNPRVSSRTGKVDDYAEWGLKLSYFGEICDILMSLSCHVILISHEAEKKDKSGEYTGKIRPLLTGSFGDKIVSKFSDWFRQLTFDKPKDFSKIDPAGQARIKQMWSMTLEEFEAMCNTFPRHTIYAWQLESDDVFDGGCSSLANFPRYIPADYLSFLKHQRKISTTQ